MAVQLQAFDLARRLQTPCWLLSVGKWHERTGCAATCVGRDKLQSRSRQVAGARRRSEAGRKFYRFIDKDGDGITDQPCPALHTSRYFARGSGHTAVLAAYTEDAATIKMVLGTALLKKCGDGEKSWCRAR